MMNLLIVTIVAGLFFAESNQQPINETNSIESNNTKGWPYFHYTNIQCWTDWFDRDDPSGTGDRETFPDLQRENPGKICPRPADIEVRTLTGLPASQVIHVNDPTKGFICRNADQSNGKCEDYRVRFSCHPPFCGEEVCWTSWYDRDDPTGTGDWELLPSLRSEDNGEICQSPLYIEAVTTDTMTPASKTGETFYVEDTTIGFVCRNRDQKDGKCQDYKVRFGCPCSEYQ